MTRPATTFVAVDWSGAKGPGKLSGIWVTALRGSETLVDKGKWTRAEAVDFVMRQPLPVVAGFDFSFGVPAWFARQLGCETIDDVWRRAATDCEAWLEPTPPFWEKRCVLPLEQRFRKCESELKEAGSQPKSVFALVGAGQVGKGSIRGMPFLTQLRDAGFAIWPFDGASERLVIEIYPTLLKQESPAFVDHEAPTPDAGDARVSARVMQARADELASLVAAIDPIERLEGNVWVPATSP